MAEKDQQALNTEMMMNRLKGSEFPADDLEGFINKDVCAFFDDLFAQTGLRKSDVIREANIDRTYGYQIFSGMRIAQRDYYLRLALAMGLDLSTTQRLLAVAQSRGLHPLLKRDAAVIFAINHGYGCDETYDFMTGLELTPLEKEL